MRDALAAHHGLAHLPIERIAVHLVLHLLVQHLILCGSHLLGVPRTFMLLAVSDTFVTHLLESFGGGQDGDPFFLGV